MAYSYNEVTATGSAQLIPVPDYVDQSHIFVSVGGVDTTSYTWVNANTVSVTATAGVKVRVYRRTSPGARVVDYIDGTSLTEAVLDADSKQAFFLAQEQLDATSDAIDAIGSLPDALAQMQVQTAASAANADAAAASAANAASTAATVESNATAAATTAATANAVTAANNTLSAAIGTTVQPYDAATAKTNVKQTFTKQQTPMNGVLTDAATINWDCDVNGQVVALTLAGNRTMAAPTNVQQFALYVMRVSQDATGSRTLAWNAAYKFGSEGAPALTSTPSKVDFLSFIGGSGNTLEFIGIRRDAV